MASVIDPVHFNDLSLKDPDEVCRNTSAGYDPETGQYRLTVWGQDVTVDPAGRNVMAGGPVAFRMDYMALFIVHCLLGSVADAVTGEWVSEKDLPGGAAFFRGPHTLPAGMVADRYGNDPDRFAGRCRELGGRPLDMADAAFAFDITPKIPVAALYWKGDEEFAPEARLLFDRSISRHLALDTVYALAVAVCDTLSG